MNFDYGLIIVVIAMVIFYIRLAQLRGRRRRNMRELELQQSRSRKKRKPGDPPLTTISSDLPTYQVASWWLVVGGVVFMLAGLAMRTSSLFPAVVLPYWWAVTVIGVALFTLGLK